MPSEIKIGFITSNPNKVREVQQCLEEMLAPSLVSVIAIEPAPDVEESGKTFCENALIKLKSSLFYNSTITDFAPSPPLGDRCRVRGRFSFVLAEDSGLIIDALDGLYGLSPFPGVYSDRWFSLAVQKELSIPLTPALSPIGGEGAYERLGYVEKNLGILKLMDGNDNRSARYEACIALWIRSTDEITTKTGVLELQVAGEPKGKNGFGYDPVMIPLCYDSSRTMAQLSAKEKNSISHRQKALSQIIPLLRAEQEEDQIQ